MSNIDFLLGELEDDIKTISPEEKQAINEADDFDDLPEELKNHVVAVHLKDLKPWRRSREALREQRGPLEVHVRLGPRVGRQNLIVKAGERFEALME